MKKNFPILVALFFCLFSKAETISSESGGIDLSVKFGMTTGSVKQGATNLANPTDEVEIQGYAGNPMVVGLNFDVHRKVTLGVELVLVADFTNKLLAEKAFYGNVAYHLLGGSKRTSTELGFVRFVHQDPYNLSLAARLGYSLFDVSDPEVSTNINGATFEIMFGLQFRQDIGEKSSIVLEFFMDMMSLPANTPPVTCNRTAILLSYRFLL